MPISLHNNQNGQRLRMSDDEVEVWMVLKFGDLIKAADALNDPTLYCNTTEPTEEFSAQEKEVIRLYSMKKMAGLL